jgi:hypothetical protein
MIRTATTDTLGSEAQQVGRYSTKDNIRNFEQKSKCFFNGNYLQKDMPAIADKWHDLSTNYSAFMRRIRSDEVEISMRVGGA